MRIATLGSMATFAGEATAEIQRHYPEFSHPTYFRSVDDCWDALNLGTIDAIVLGLERTGQPHRGERIVARDLYVVGYLDLPMKCNLYAKPGTRKEDIRRIRGHGSIQQCQKFLDENFPRIPRVEDEFNSIESARAVMSGDGSEAVVGSCALENALPDLETFAQGIDDGAIARWWVITLEPHFLEQPNCIVVAAHLAPDGDLGRLVIALNEVGFLLSTVAAFPGSPGVARYNYLLTLEGSGRLRDIEAVAEKFENTRLVGAFVRRGKTSGEHS